MSKIETGYEDGINLLYKHGLTIKKVAQIHTFGAIFFCISPNFKKVYIYTSYFSNISLKIRILLEDQ